VEQERHGGVAEEFVLSFNGIFVHRITDEREVQMKELRFFASVTEQD
jgi:hypothetical protein